MYVCVSLVARGVEGALRADVKELLDPMMASGLSPPLTVALQELATEIPQLKVSLEVVEVWCSVSREGDLFVMFYAEETRIAF